MRCPTPQSGAVRNSSGPAEPCVMPSLRPLPMWWRRRSEKRFTVWLERAALGVVGLPLAIVPVANDGVWQAAQPVTLKRARPLMMDAVSGAGVGGANNNGVFYKIPLGTSGALQVLSGTLLTRWTNGRLRPGRHRVVAGGTVTRRSTAVFCS